MKIPNILPLFVLVLLASPYAWQQVASPQQAEAQKNDSGMFQPQSHIPVTYRDNEGDLAITVQGEELYVSVKSTRSNSGLIKLPPELVQANEIRCVGPNRAVLLGMENGDVYYVVVLDTLLLNVSDQFACYFPSLSPDGRYISFIKFSAAHPDGPVEDHYMLYDLTKPASGNRPTGVGIQDWMTVGTTIYPVGIGNRLLDNYGRGDHTTATTEFMWSPYSDAILFADRSHDLLSVILAGIESNGVPRVRQVDLSLADVCSKGRPARRSSCMVKLTKAEFDKDSSGSVRLVINGVGTDASLEPQTYEFKYSQFR